MYPVSQVVTVCAFRSHQLATGRDWIPVTVSIPGCQANGQPPDNNMPQPDEGHGILTIPRHCWGEETEFDQQKEWLYQIHYNPWTPTVSIPDSGCHGCNSW